MTRETTFPKMDETTFMRIKPMTKEAPESPKARFLSVSMSVEAHKEFMASP